MVISCEISFRWLPPDLTDDKSTLVQVMTWCRQATSHYLGQFWPMSLLSYGVTKCVWCPCPSALSTSPTSPIRCPISHVGGITSGHWAINHSSAGMYTAEICQQMPDANKHYVPIESSSLQIGISEISSMFCEISLSIILTSLLEFHEWISNLS